MKPGGKKPGLLSGFFSGIKENVSLLLDPVSAGAALQAEDFPLLPLRDLVLFPQTVVPLFITYLPGMIALEQAIARDNRLFAACLKKHERITDEDEPCSTGTVVRIIQHLKLPDNTYRVVLQGEYRGTITALNSQNGLSMVRVEPLKITGLSDPLNTEDLGLMRSLQKSFVQYAEYSKKINTDTLSAAERTENPERLANLICNASYLKSGQKTELLGMADTRERLLAILETLERENEIYSVQKNISGKVRSRIDRHQREYILHEQLKEINKELGKDKIEDEFALLEKSIAEKSPPTEVIAKTSKEIARLRKLQPLSPEAGVLRGYLEWISDLPWSGSSVDSGDLAEAGKILDEDHFGMRKAKDRILEFIAVRQLLSWGMGNGEQGTGIVDKTEESSTPSPQSPVPNPLKAQSCALSGRLERARPRLANL